MYQFTGAVTEALATENWYAALTLTLILPDICGRLEHPTMASGKRYASWFESWVEPTYTAIIGAEQKRHVFLSGHDCYALRCSLLHQGEVDISQQNARKVLEDFHFIAPRKNVSIHRNQRGNQLILQVDRFCEDICEGVAQWMASVGDDEDIQGRMNKLISIEVLPKDGPISIQI